MRVGRAIKVVIVLVLVLVAIGVRAWVHESSVRDSGVQTRATVTRVDLVSRARIDFARVRYLTEAGTVVESTIDVSGMWPRLAAGDVIDIRYSADEPKEAYVAEGGSRGSQRYLVWLIMAIPILIAVALKPKVVRRPMQRMRARKPRPKRARRRKPKRDRTRNRNQNQNR